MPGVRCVLRTGLCHNQLTKLSHTKRSDDEHRHAPISMASISGSLFCFNYILDFDIIGAYLVQLKLTCFLIYPAGEHRVPESG